MLKSFLQQTCFYRAYRFYFRNKKNEIERFCDEYFQGITDEQKAWIEKDMKYWYLKRNISPTQYWEQSFDKLSKAAKKSMLPKSEIFSFDRKYNPRTDVHIVGNKYECYERFKDFFGRECMLVNDTPEDRKKFEDFCSRKKKLIIKPLFILLSLCIYLLELIKFNFLKCYQ